MRTLLDRLTRLKPIPTPNLRGTIPLHVLVTDHRRRERERSPRIEPTRQEQERAAVAVAAHELLAAADVVRAGDPARMSSEATGRWEACGALQTDFWWGRKGEKFFRRQRAGKGPCPKCSMDDDRWPDELGSPSRAGSEP